MSSKRKSSKKSIFSRWLKIFLIIIFSGLAVVCFHPVQSQAQTNNRPALNGFQAYWGDLHMHSGYSSDGPCALPDQVFDAAKALGNDFGAVTDHDSDFGNPKIACNLGTEPNKFGKIKESANRKNQDGVFVALHGFEWTHLPDHIILINNQNGAPPASINAFFDWLGAQPDKDNIIAQFNHPLPADTNSFPFRSNLVSVFRTIETNAFELKSIYTPFLKKGWKVGAVGYGDSHDISYMGSRTYGVWAGSLNKADILAALLQRRTFSAAEPQPKVAPTIATALLANGHWMGETINASNFNFQIFVTDPVRNISRVELVGGGPYVGGNGYIVLNNFFNLGQHSSQTFSFTPQDPKLFKFYYLRVFQPNSKGVEYLSSLSAPIFVNYDPTVKPSPTVTPTSTPTPTLTPTPTSPPAGSCTSLGASFKDRYFAYTAAAQPLEWSWTNQPVFSPSVKGKVEKIKLYLSWTKNSQIKVKIISPDGQSSEIISTYLSGSSGLTTKEFYFSNLPLVEPSKTYTIAIQEAYGDIYIYRSGGTLTFEEWLKPCLN